MSCTSCTRFDREFRFEKLVTTAASGCGTCKLLIAGIQKFVPELMDIKWIQLDQSIGDRNALVVMVSCSKVFEWRRLREQIEFYPEDRTSSGYASVWLPHRLLAYTMICNRSNSFTRSPDFHRLSKSAILSQPSHTAHTIGPEAGICKTLAPRMYH